MMKVASSVLSGGKYFVDPEVRAEKVSQTYAERWTEEWRDRQTDNTDTDAERKREGQAARYHMQADI